VLELAESLLLAESISPRALARGLFLEATQQMSLVQALLVTGAVDEAKVEEAVAKEGDEAPLTTITPSLSLVQRLPRGLCPRLLAVPIGKHPETGEIEVAVVDLRDEHALGEVAFFLRAGVRAHRATVSAIRGALEQIQRAEPALVPQPAHGERTRTPIWGTPVVSVVPAAAPHASPGDMPIPLMRRSVAPSKDDSAVLELRTPASSRPAPDTIRQNEEPVFALRAPPSVRRPVSVLIAETRLEPTPNAAVTIPAPKDPRHTMVTAPAPARRSEPPPAVNIEMPKSRRSTAAPRFAPSRSEALGAPLLPFAEITPILAAMEEANDRDAIIALLISGMRAFARRVAVLAVKRDSFVGWSCNAEFGDARSWRGVSVPANVPSVLATAAAGTPYLGPLFRTDGHMPILEFMHETSRDVAVTGVRVDMHPALVLLADELGDTALGTRRMEQLAKTAGIALARVLRKK
jgi:hypothetical protein